MTMVTYATASNIDKIAYIELLSKYCRDENVSIWAYCLMDNHVHIVAVPPNESSLALATGEAHRMYSRMINLREGWRGYLWQGRFKSYPMDERHAFAAIRYIERNPVRAHIVRSPEEYTWSSAKSHVFGLKDKLLFGEEIKLMGIDDWRAYLSCEDGEQNISLLRKHEKTGRPLGSDKFIDKLETNK